MKMSIIKQPKLTDWFEQKIDIKKQLKSTINIKILIRKGTEAWRSFDRRTDQMILAAYLPKKPNLNDLFITYRDSERSEFFTTYVVDKILSETNRDNEPYNPYNLIEFGLLLKLRSIEFHICYPELPEYYLKSKKKYAIKTNPMRNLLF